MARAHSLRPRREARPSKPSVHVPRNEDSRASAEPAYVHKGKGGVRGERGHQQSLHCVQGGVVVGRGGGGHQQRRDIPFEGECIDEQQRDKNG